MLGNRGHRLLAPVALIAAVCLLALGMLIAPGQTLAAARTGSITVSVVAEDANGSHALTGDAFTLVRVAAATVHEGASSSSAGIDYRMAADFKKLDRDWASLDASQVAAAAHELEAAARENGALNAGAVARVGAGETEIGFSDLDPGLYLLVRTTVADANKDLVVDPVLVGVPLAEDGALTYDVHVTPKFEWTGVEHPGNGDNGETPGTGEVPGANGGGESPLGFLTPGWIPQTGDYAVATVLALLVAGVCAILIGRRLRRGARG